MAVSRIRLSSLFALVGGSTVRVADAHLDAPPPSVLDLAEPPAIRLPVERLIPSNLDQPLAAFDPGAIPSAPRSPVRAVAPLAPGERISSVELPPRRLDGQAPSIEAMFARLHAAALRHAG